MLPAFTISEIRRVLSASFRFTDTAERSPLRMVGILLAPRGAAVCAEEILPRLDDYHHRSAKNIDFFCPGYGYGSDWGTEKDIVARTTDRVFGHRTEWYYNSGFFNDCLNELAALIPKWEYSGEVDLLLLNASWDETGEALLDFSSGVCLRLSQMRRDEIIGSVPELFEKIFQYAMKQDGKDPTWGFSGKMGRAVAKSWFIELVLSLLPPKTGDLWKNGRHYAHVALA